MRLTYITRAVLVLIVSAMPVYSASAATAWVLWQKFTVNENIGKAEWTVVTSTGSKDDCMARVKMELIAIKKTVGEVPKNESILDTDASITWYISGNAGKMHLLKYDYLCLPDTVDPRRMKGPGK